MIELLNKHLADCSGQLQVLLKLESDPEYWQMTALAVDVTGIAVERPGGRRECYPWRMVEAVVLPGQSPERGI